MVQITTTIDGIHGTVKILIDGDEGDRQQLDFRWCQFDDEGTRTGFVTSFNEQPILLTERAAEQFIRMVLFALMRSLNMKFTGVTVLNHLGENLQDVEFMPPTFDGNEADILEFVAAQDSIKKLFAVYEQTGDLSSDFIEVCQAEGILDDILSLVQIKASGFVLAVRKPNTSEENQNG